MEEADAAEEELLKEDEPETNVSLRASDSFIHNESTVTCHTQLTLKLN